MVNRRTSGERRTFPRLPRPALAVLCLPTVGGTAPLPARAAAFALDGAAFDVYGPLSSGARVTAQFALGATFMTLEGVVVRVVENDGVRRVAVAWQLAPRRYRRALAAAFADAGA